MRAPLAIIGMGAITAVGWDATQTCAAIRAGITGFADSDYFQEGEEPVPLIAACAPTDPPPDDAHEFDRLKILAIPALQECLASSGLSASSTPILLGIREPHRGEPDSDTRLGDILKAIGAGLSCQLHRDSAVIPEGNASAYRALKQARDWIESGRFTACIVGGVDSFVNVDDLTRYEEAHRLKREGVAQGFIPGEGAAFVAVSSIGADDEGRVFGRINGIGLANEDPSVTAIADGHPTGLGLKKALENTIADAEIPESSITLRVSDMNGELYRGVESMFVLSRFYQTRRVNLDMWLPAACVGEIGAAVGSLLIILAAIGTRKGYAPGHVVMCETSSDSGFRGGCLVTPAAH